MSKIKIIDEKEKQKQTKKAKRKNRTMGTDSIAKGWEKNDFAEHLN